MFQASVSSNLPVYGPSTVQLTSITGNLDSFESYASAEYFGAIVLGKNALAIGIADRMEFKKRMADYEEL